MNDTKKLDVQICIEGLGWIILGVLRRENAKRPRGYVKLKDIREKSGIRKKLEASGGNSVFESKVTRKTLEYLQHKKYVENSSFEPAYWRITDTGLDKHRMNATQELDLETCIDELTEIILDVLVETGKTGNYMRLSTVGRRSEIEDTIATPENKDNFRDAFTDALLEYLQRQGRVEKGPGQGQWKISDSEYQERRA